MPMMVEVSDAQGIILSALEAIDHRCRVPLFIIRQFETRIP